MLHSFGAMNFLTFAAWFFLFSVLVCVVVSLLTPPPAPESITGLTYGTMTDQQKAENRASYSIWDVVMSVVVVGIVVFVMISFRG